MRKLSRQNDAPIKPVSMIDEGCVAQSFAFDKSAFADRIVKEQRRDTQVRVILSRSGIAIDRRVSRAIETRITRDRGASVCTNGRVIPVKSTVLTGARDLHTHYVSARTFRRRGSQTSDRHLRIRDARMMYGRLQFPRWLSNVVREKAGCMSV